MHAVGKYRRAVRVKITIEDIKRGNIAAEFKREKTVSGSRRSDETKTFTLSRTVCVETHHTCDAYPIQEPTRLLYMDSNCARKRNWRRQYSTPNFEEAD